MIRTRVARLLRLEARRPPRDFLSIMERCLRQMDRSTIGIEQSDAHYVELREGIDRQFRRQHSPGGEVG